MKDGQYAWVITRDRFAEQFRDEKSTVGTIGPRNTEYTKEKITKEGVKFSMYCDDKECLLEGYLVGGEGLEPLDDFGTAMYSCVHIKINGEWV